MRSFRLLALLAFLCPPTGGCQTVSAIPLTPDQQLTVSGVLTMQPAGRLQFVTVETDQAYVPVFSGPGAAQLQEGKPAHEIALARYSNYGLLYQHRGERVTVTGTLRTDDASPYYRDGMRLDAEHIRTANGTELMGERPLPMHVAADVGLYDATVILPADLAAPWVYRVEGPAADAEGMLRCSSNGGGDVVNCNCADGFRARSASTAIGGKTSSSSARKDESGWSQFEVGDEAVEVKLRLTCER
jgi:hypothetical protein